MECEAMGHALGYAFIYGGKSVSACSQTAYVRTSYARTATVTPITATEAQDPAQETLKLRTSSLFIPIQDSLKQQKIAPFSIENSRRRRFML